MQEKGTDSFFLITSVYGQMTVIKLYNIKFIFLFCSEPRSYKNASL